MDTIARARETNTPTELANFPAVDTLWPKLLRRANPHHLAQFGIPDLAFRLVCQEERERRNGGHPDLRARAVIWRGVAERCTRGTGEVTTATEEALRQWMPGMVEKPKSVGIRCSSCGKSMRVVRDSRFSSCRKCRGASRRSEAVARVFNRTGEVLQGWKLCRRCNGPFESRKKNSRYCSQRCQKRAYRDGGKNQRSIPPAVREQGILGVATH